MPANFTPHQERTDSRIIKSRNEKEKIIAMRRTSFLASFFAVASTSKRTNSVRPLRAAHISAVSPSCCLWIYNQPSIVRETKQVDYESESFQTNALQRMNILKRCRIFMVLTIKLLQSSKKESQAKSHSIKNMWNNACVLKFERNEKCPTNYHLWYIRAKIYALKT